MGISVERHGYTSCIALMRAITKDLLDGGFTTVYPASFNPSTDQKVILEAGPTVDPLQGEQPWRMHINAVSDFQIQINVATPIQLTESGVVPTLSGALDGNEKLTVGLCGSVTSQAGSAGGHATTTALNWITRDGDDEINANNMTSYPMSYRLSTSDHGFCLFVWYDATDNKGNKFSWITVQRPVDSATGETYTTGKAPVYCVYSYVGGINKFVVREADVFKPSPSVAADKNTEDSKAILNSANQVAITEENKYIVTLPNGLNTPRCAYTHELDLIAYTSADVISQWADVPLTIYGEAQPRVYKAMSANSPNNTGMRILFLTAGPTTKAPVEPVV